MNANGTQERALTGGSAAVVALASVAAGAAVIGWLGIRLGGDSARYIEGAAMLLDGESLTGKHASYAGYTALVALAQWAVGDPRMVVALHVLFAAVAAMALWDMGGRLAGSMAGLLCAGMVVLNPDIARWQAYILTDSVYISCVVIACWATWRAVERGGYWMALAGTLVLFTALVRPNGWILLPTCGGVVAWHRLPGRRLVKGLAILVMAAGFVAAAATLRPFRAGIAFESPGRWLREGLVVWGYQGWRVDMPEDPVPVTGDWRTDIGYAARNPLASARLAIARVAAELAHVRPFYSAAHNALVVLGLMVVYPLAALGAWRWRRHAIAQLALGAIGAHLLIVGLTFADWDGRFLLYVFPPITLLASCEAVIRLSVRSAPSSSA